MYDSINLILNKEDCPNINFIKETQQYLNSILNHGYDAGGEYITGKLDNLIISIRDNRIKITGNLCKYYLGNNFKTMTRGDTKEAIAKISDFLHLPFHKANVTRIDFGQNLIMKYDEGIYYPYLGEAQYYKRLEQNNGLYYINQKRQLVFYGKVYEQRIKNQRVPELYKNRYVLRYEIRFIIRLREQFNRPIITGELLYDEVFYRELVERWKNEYLAIQKIKTKLDRMNPTGSTKEFSKYMAYIGILELGQGKVLNKVKEWQKRAEISKKQAYDLRRDIRQISNLSINEKGNDLINELDRKIKAAAYWY